MRKLSALIVAVGFATQSQAQPVDGSRDAAIERAAIHHNSGKRVSSTDKSRSTATTCRTTSQPACGPTTASTNGGQRGRAPENTTQPESIREEAPGISNGHDITRPEHRVDIFLNNNRSSDGTYNWTTTLRYERPFMLENAWKLAVRIEAPFVVTGDPNAAPPSPWSSGYGDTLFQAVVSKELDSRQGFGAGLRFIAPTATGDQFGNGRWRMLPTVGYRYSLPEISRDSYFQFVGRYAFDFAGDATRRHTSELQMAPSINLGLPDKWYVTFFPSTDIRYNFINREWFVPFNLEIGKQWSQGLLTALEVGVPFFDTAHPVYKYKIELHVGFRF